MVFAVIDIQGFRVPEFVPKELAIFDGRHMAHYVFEPPYSIDQLTFNQQRSVRWLENNYHQLRWTDGDVKLSRLKPVLDRIRDNYDEVYCKGAMKREFLYTYFGENFTIHDLRDAPYLREKPKDMAKYLNTDCMYHKRGMCALSNVKVFYNYINNMITASTDRQQQKPPSLSPSTTTKTTTTKTTTAAAKPQKDDKEKEEEEGDLGNKIVLIFRMQTLTL
jgi:hypothetical protein